MTRRPDVDLIDGRFYGGDPLPALAWMRENEPLYRDKNGLIAVTRHADVMEVSKNPEIFCSGQGFRPDVPMQTVLVHAEIDGERLDDDSLIFETLLILNGGDETTRHVITGGMFALMENPGERAKLAAHPERMETAVEEMLRWVSPIQNMMRTATGATELGGEKFEAGDRFLMMYGYETMPVRFTPSSPGQSRSGGSPSGGRA